MPHIIWYVSPPLASGSSTSPLLMLLHTSELPGLTFSQPWPKVWISLWIRLPDLTPLQCLDHRSGFPHRLRYFTPFETADTPILTSASCPVLCYPPKLRLFYLLPDLSATMLPAPLPNRLHATHKHCPCYLWHACCRLAAPVLDTCIWHMSKIIPKSLL